MDPEEVKGVEDAVSKALAEKLPEILKTVEEASVQNAQKAAVTKTQDVDKTKSVMRTVAEHGTLAYKAPFITLSEDMEKFVNGFLMVAKGDYAGLMRSGLVAEKDFAGQNETTPDEGGYLVAPTEFDTAILQYQFQESIVRPRATVRTVRGNTFTVTNLDQSSNSYAGAVMTWNVESGEISSSKIKWGKKEIQLGKLTGKTIITNELLQDSIVDVANYIIQVFGAAVTYMEDMAFFQGAADGGGEGVNAPIGILNTVGIQTVNRQEANKVGYKDINAMYHKLRTTMRKNCVWVVSSTAAEYLDEQVDAYDRPLLSPSIHDTMTMRMKGLPVIELDEAYLPALGTKGDIILVDLSKYYIVDKLGLRIDTSIHDRFDYDETAVRFVKRVSGKLVMPIAAVALDVPAVY